MREKVQKEAAVNIASKLKIAAAVCFVHALAACSQQGSPNPTIQVSTSGAASTTQAGDSADHERARHWEMEQKIDPISKKRTLIATSLWHVMEDQSIAMRLRIKCDTGKFRTTQIEVSTWQVSRSGKLDALDQNF